MQRMILARLDEIADSGYTPLSWCEISAFNVPNTPSAAASFRRAARGLSQAGLVEAKLVALPPSHPSASSHYNKGVQGPRRRLVIRPNPTPEELTEGMEIRARATKASLLFDKASIDFVDWYWSLPAGMYLDEIIQDYEDGIDPWG